MTEGEPWVGWALPYSVCLSSSGLPWVRSSPGMAAMQESKGKHSGPQKGLSQNWLIVTSASFHWLQKITWLNLN